MSKDKIELHITKEELSSLTALLITAVDLEQDTRQLPDRDWSNLKSIQSKIISQLSN